MEKYIAYYRVSTKRQGQSGLGLEAQKNTVENFVVGKGKVIDSFVEIESGKNDNRKELEKAIQKAKEQKAVLIIAKLDRLSRNASFIFSLRDSGVSFICCDLPEANTLTIGIFAAYAQHERELISKRIKEALAAKKARGEKVGNPSNFTNKTRSIGRKAKSEKARDINCNALQVAKDALAQKLSLSKISERLNSYGLKTSRGNNFTKASVQGLLKLNK